MAGAATATIGREAAKDAPLLEVDGLRTYFFTAEGIVRGDMAPDDLHPKIRAGLRPYLDAALDAGAALPMARFMQCTDVDEVIDLLSERLEHQARWRAEARRARQGRSGR